LFHQSSPTSPDQPALLGGAQWKEIRRAHRLTQCSFTWKGEAIMGIHEEPTLQHWNYFLALDDDVARMARYLELTEANFSSYSLELARILFAAASEVDVVAKNLCKKINENSKARSIDKYMEEILPHYPSIPEAIIYIPRFGLTFNPWEKWGENKKPLWWDAYNNVKHHRHTNFSDASLKHAMNAVAGLFVLLLFLYRVEAKNGQLNPDPSLFRAGPPFHVDKSFYSPHATIYQLVGNDQG
jgi:hypothetical protein